MDNRIVRLGPLRFSIKKGEKKLSKICAVYQPIVDARTRVPIGYEALARGVKGETPEAVFMGLRGRKRRDVEIQALRTAAIAPPEGLLFVNLSPAVFGYRGGKPARAALARLPAERVVVEITEKPPVPDTFDTAIWQWKDAGYKIAVDDVGASPLSMALVFMARPRYVKLARELVARFPREAEAVGSVVRFARRWGAEVIAEGVETEEEIDAVQKAGITLAQGYLLGRPQFVKDLVAEGV